MNWRLVRRSRFLILGAVGLLLAVGNGCNFGPPEQTLKSSAEAPSKVAAIAATPSSSDDPGIDLQCAVNHIQKASVPFHWSFKKVVTPETNADWEADVSADSIAGTFIDSSGTRTIEGMRSDSTSWSTAVLVLIGPLPASTFALVNNSSATVRAGTENMNGEDTIKYAIDTSQDTPADASLIKSVLGEKGFVKGAAWVTRAGCPVKFVLNVEQYYGDGTAHREHYEANVTQQ